MLIRQTGASSVLEGYHLNWLLYIYVYIYKYAYNMKLLLQNREYKLCQNGETQNECPSEEIFTKRKSNYIQT